MFLFMMMLGFAAYLLSGLGLGGAALLLPLLCRFTDLASARADSMFAYLPAAFAASAVHFVKGKRPNGQMIGLMPVGLLGAVLGGLIAGSLPNKILRPIYGTFLILFGIKMLFTETKIGQTIKKWKFLSFLRKIFCKFFDFF